MHAGRLAARVVATLGGAFLLWMVAAAALDRAASTPSGRRWDAIVVLGCRVRADGVPSDSLDRRVRHAVGLWRRGLAPRLVMTGGAGEGEPLSEARAAARLARDLGVPEEAILLEERSTSTEENARFAREVIGRARVLVVSDAYHVTRGERVFQRYFHEVETAGVRGAPLGGAVREVVAIAIYALLGRLDDPAVPVSERLATRLVLPSTRIARRAQGRATPAGKA
jgi:uncharacterized SAM-binding protein YcdF (DUF218 family)